VNRPCRDERTVITGAYSKPCQVAIERRPIDAKYARYCKWLFAAVTELPRFSCLLDRQRGLTAPVAHPWLWAAFNPALVRSMISARSNSASAPMM